MATEITNKEELVSLTTKLIKTTSDLELKSSSIINSLKFIENYDGIDIAGSGKKLSDNIEIVLEDLDTVVTNINNYAKEIINVTGTEFTDNNIESYLESVNGNVIDLPDGLGSIYDYMWWQSITAASSDQYILREIAGMNFDEEGFGRISDRYVVATTLTFGNVGDYIDVIQNDGTVIKCIIGDIKSLNDPDCNKWGHRNGASVIEFIVDKESWHGTNKSVIGYHPEWNQTVKTIINKGNYFNLSNSYDTSTSTSSKNGSNWTSLANATLSSSGAVVVTNASSHSSGASSSGAYSSSSYTGGSSTLTPSSATYRSHQ